MNEAAAKKALEYAFANANGARRITTRNLPPQPKGHCTLCGEKVKPPRRTWCGSECVSTFLAACGNPRSLVRRRDHGICARCGLDCEAVHEALHELWDAVKRSHWGTRLPIGDAFRDFTEELGIADWLKSKWEAHHIVPVSEGGVSSLDNFETLCVWCHKRETRELVRRQALERQEQETGQAFMRCTISVR